jgi:hypothetical protein
MGRIKRHASDGEERERVRQTGDGEEREAGE